MSLAKRKDKLLRLALAGALVVSLVPIAAFSSAHRAHAATLTRCDVEANPNVRSGGIVLDADLSSQVPTFNVPVSTKTLIQAPSGGDLTGPNDTVYQYRYALATKASDSSKGNILNTTITAKWTNAGFDASGDRIDLVITWLPDSKWYSNKDRSDVVLLERYVNNSWNTAGICLGCDEQNYTNGGKISCEQHVQYNFYKAGTTTPASGSFLTRFTDLDTDGWSSGYSDDWVERIEFISGHDQAMFTSTGNILKIGANRNGEANTDYRATKRMDGSSLDSGVVTNLSPGANFWFYASNGSTDILDQFNAHKITMSTGAHGSVSSGGKSDTIPVGWRGSRTISITPDTGYKVSNVVVNGVSEGAKTSRTFENVTQDQSISATFAPITYQIRFNTNGGSGQMSNMSLSYDVSANLTNNAFYRSGFTFQGWNTMPDGSGTSYANAQEIRNLTSTDGAIIDLYAQWSANSYTVAFNPNTGDGEMPDQSFRYDQTQALSSNTFSKLGYTFTGWNTASDGSATSFGDKQSVVNLTAENNGKVTLFAQWNANNYRIIYNANTGEGFMGDQTLSYDTEATLHANRFVKDGYRFNGWNTASDGTGKTYHNKQSVVNLAAEDGAAIELYAQWQPIRYSVVFFGNGGSDGSGNVMSAYQKMIFDECEELAENIFNREGYTWQNWNSDSNGSGTTYTDKQLVENLTDVAGAVIPLYSQWQVNKYSVSFNANGGEGEMADQSFLYDHAKELTKNCFTKTGFSFQGWSTEPGGAVAYEDSQSVLNLTSVDGGKVTLYAVWEEDPNLRITYMPYDANHLSVSNPSEELAPVTGTVLGSTASTKIGYKFTGWKTASGELVSNALTLIPKRGGDGLWHAETYFAYASPIDYKIVYNGNGAEGSMPNQNATYDEPIALTKNAFTHEGWKFLGWNTEPDGSGTSYANKQSVVNLASSEGAEAVLYAQWEQKSFDVDFTDGQGGNLSSQSVDYGQSAKAPADPTREGYTFTGWDKAFDNITSDTTVNAKWRINSYTIAYDANGGEGVMADQGLKYDETAKLSRNNFARAGHTFQGWNTMPDGSGAAYKNEQEVSTLTTRDGEKITLYAQWKIERYDVTFDDGLGNTIDKQEVEYGGSAVAPADPEREGYKFQGWSGDYTNVTKDTAVKASWTTAEQSETASDVTPAEKQGLASGDEYAKTGSNLLGWLCFAGLLICAAALVLTAERKRQQHKTDEQENHE